MYCNSDKKKNYHRIETVPLKWKSVYIYLLTQWSRAILEKLTGSAASQEIPHIL